MKELAREELVNIVGQESVDKLEDISCHYVGEVTGWDKRAGMIEFQSILSTDDYVIKSYFYQTKEDFEQEGVELDELNWKIEFYTYEEQI